MKRLLLIISLFTTLAAHAPAQTKVQDQKQDSAHAPAQTPVQDSLQVLYISADVDFINYLIGNNMSRDAVNYLQGSDFAPSDTLDFLKGFSLYSANRLEDAVLNFDKVSKGSPFFEKSILFGAVSDAYLGRYDSGARRMTLYDGTNLELQQYMISGFALLQNDRRAYEEAARSFSYSDYSMKEGQQVFDMVYHERFEQKGKSPALAAAYSAVLPGLGKAYAGRKDEAIVSFLTVGIFGALTADCYVRKGPSDWRTIAFGALGSLFYIANIYGSYVSVGIYNDNLRDAQNSTVVFNLHVPVRSLYK